MGHQTFFKPAKGTDLVERHAARAFRKNEAKKRAHRERMLAYQTEQARRMAVFHRDKGRCRVCGRDTVLTGNLFALAHCHHIVYRSAGGSDEAENRCILCYECHADEHAHRIDIQGNGNETLEIVVFGPDRQVAAYEESPCPSR
jgi:5-methylcytosine-specific restriction endonuclease McrA